MAQSLKFKNLDEALAVYADLPWQRDGDGKVSVYDAKAEEYVPINAGDYIVSIGERYEVSDTEPEKAKPVEAPKKDAKADKDEAPTVEHPMGAESTVSDLRE